MGEFKGRAQGFHGPITATVEIDNGESYQNYK